MTENISVTQQINSVSAVQTVNNVVVSAPGPQGPAGIFIIDNIPTIYPITNTSGSISINEQFFVKNNISNTIKPDSGNNTPLTVQSLQQNFSDSILDISNNAGGKLITINSNSSLFSGQQVRIVTNGPFGSTDDYWQIAFLSGSNQFQVFGSGANGGEIRWSSGAGYSGFVSKSEASTYIFEAKKSDGTTVFSIKSNGLVFATNFVGDGHYISNINGNSVNGPVANSINSSSSNYSVSSENSNTTSQTDFNTLTISGSNVATQAYVNAQDNLYYASAQSYANSGSLNAYSQASAFSVTTANSASLNAYNAASTYSLSAANSASLTAYASAVSVDQAYARSASLTAYNNASAFAVTQSNAASLTAYNNASAFAVTQSNSASLNAYNTASTLVKTGSWNNTNASVNYATYSSSANISSSANYATEAGISGSTRQTSFSSLAVNGDINISGNAYVSGSTFTVSASNISTTDPLIYIGMENPANINDLGIVGSFTSSSYQHTGIVRDHSDGVWKLFSGVTTEPTNVINFASAVYDTLKIGGLQITSSAQIANLNADLLDGYNATYFAPISSPSFTGTPLAPTAASNVSNTQIATTAYVNSAVTNHASLSASTGYYGSFYSSTTQTLTSANTPKTIRFDQSFGSQGLTLTSGSLITFTYPGVYNINFSGQISGNGSDTYNIWLRKNGSDIPLTNREVITTNQGHTVEALINHTQTFAAGDTAQVVWMSTDAATVLQYQPATASSPAVPSTTLNVNLVSYIQSASTVTYAYDSASLGGISATDYALKSYVNTQDNNYYASAQSYANSSSLNAYASAVAVSQAYSNSASTTGNAATATALQTSRTINNQPFDGTANITVADSTKLPLTGGTLSGQLAVSTSSTSSPQVTVQPTGSFTKSVTSITYITSTAANVNLSDTKGLWVGQVVTGSGFAATSYNTSMTITSVTANTSISVTGTGFAVGGASTGTLTASGTGVNVQEWQSSTGTAVSSVDGSGNFTTLGNLKTSSGTSSVTTTPVSVTVASNVNSVAITSGGVTMTGTAGSGINAGSNAIQTTGNISGATITATTFSGNGASLTSIPNTALSSISAFGLTSTIQREEAFIIVPSGGQSIGTATSVTGLFAGVSGATTGAVTLNANKTYTFEIVASIVNASTANTTSLYFGWVNGTGTLTGQTWQGLARRYANGGTTTAAVAGAEYSTYYSGGSGVSTGYSVTSTGTGWNQHLWVIKGIIRTTNAGTFIPSVQVSTSMGVLTVQDGSYLSIKEIGADTLTTKGTWS